MTNMHKSIGGASLLVLGLASAPAYAATTGTEAGTLITNQVSVSYKVGGASQTAQGGSNSFAVDRKVSVDVANNDSGAIDIQINEKEVQKYTITNSSNGYIDIALSATTTSGTGSTKFTPGAYTIYKDDGDGVFDPTTDPAHDGVGDSVVTFLDYVQAGTTQVVFVQTTAPSSGANGLVATTKLTATAHSAYAPTAGATDPTNVPTFTAPVLNSNKVITTAGSIKAPVADNQLGDALVSSAGSADTTGLPTDSSGNLIDGVATIQNVFFDDNGSTTSGGANTEKDGKDFNDQDWTLKNTTLKVTKTMTVLKDAYNGTSNAKAIPGALVKYCITVNNPAGGAQATGVDISDTLPSTVEYYAKDVNDATFDVVVGADCSATTSLSGMSGSYDAATTTVSGSVGTMDANSSNSLIFHAKIR